MSCRIRRTQMMAQAGLCEKPADPKLKTEMDAKLVQMQAERNRQDQLWSSTTYANGKTVELSTGTLNSSSGNHTRQGV